MNAAFTTAIASAQSEASRVFNEDLKVDFSEAKVAVGGENSIVTHSEGNVVTAEIKQKYKPEGPSLAEIGKTSSSVHAAPSTQSWGKPNRR